MEAEGQAFHDITEGLAHGTRVTAIRALSATWDVLSIVVLTCYALSRRRQGHGAWGKVRRQGGGGGVGRLSGMPEIRCLLRPGNQQSAVTGFLPTSRLWGPLQPRVEGDNVGEHSTVDRCVRRFRAHY